MLTLKFDKDTGRMIGLDADGYPLIPAVLKRRETVPVSITLYSAGVPAVFSGGTLSIGLKALGLYSGTIAANVSLTLSGTTYSGDLSLSTTTIATLFAGVGLPPTEPDFVSLAAEVTHSSGWTAEAITLRCDNDYIVGGETLPGDEVLTAADRVQTGLDRVQTGLDRVQTGLDRTAASDSAATASTQAGLASGYKADAEAAAAAAEALALVQVDIREQSTAPADTSVLWLDTTEESPMSADVIAAAASADAAAASAILTAADRVQTGLDRTQTGTDRASATISQASAAASASTAVNALALQFKGGIAGASVPATLPLAGDYYEIITAGYSAASGKTWAVGDKAVYNGSSGQWTQITGYFAPITSAFIARRNDGYPNSDGATSNRAQIYGPFDAVNNPREYVAGVPTLTLAGIVTVPSATWSDDSYICGFTSTATPVSAPINELNALILSVGSSSNSLQIIQRGSVVGNYRLFSFANFRSTYSGQVGFLKAYFVQGSTNPVVSWNGVDISSSFSASTGGTPPSWLDATMVPTYRLNGFRWPSGPAPIVTPILGTTSAADDAFHLSTGKWPAWVVNGGQCFTPPNFTFVSGSNGGSITGSAASATGITLTKTAGSTGTYDVANASVFGSLGSNIFGVPLRPYMISGSVSYSSGSGSILMNIGGSTTLTVSANGSFNAVITAPDANTNHRFQFWGNVSGDAFVAVISNFKIFPCGGMTIPAIQPINVLDDVSGIGGNQGRLLGMTPVTDKRSTRILGRINAASATNQQILGGALLPVPLNHALEFVDVETDGSVTLSLGDGTTATRYTASTALTAGRTRIALTTPFAADSAKTGLYVNVTVAGGTYAQFSILGHLLK